LPVLDSDFLRQREAALQTWFSDQLPGLRLGVQHGELAAVSGDASFRRYFRAMTDAGPCILVDAPPPQEDCAGFVKVAALFGLSGVAVPRVLAADLVQGFMCLEDLGNILLWTPLHQAREAGEQDAINALYQGAFEQLLLIQQIPVQALVLPPYDAALLQREMALFGQWFCAGLLQYTLDTQEKAMLETVFRALTDQALAQPRVAVHRDFHSRNLMVREVLPLGVIDFQDAVTGPATYDLVSLLRDCYISWPQAQVSQWIEQYRVQAMARGIQVAPTAAAFARDFDFMGLQRHLKVLGIFSRLWLRDAKPGYLQDLPLTFRYLVRVLAQYPEFSAMSDWLNTIIDPLLPAALARVRREAGL